MTNRFEGERKRNGNKVVEIPKITFKQGLHLWLNQWRWSNIKMMWRQDYKRVYYQSVHNLNRINQKLGR